MALPDRPGIALARALVIDPPRFAAPLEQKPGVQLRVGNAQPSWLPNRLALGTARAQPYVQAAPEVGL